MKLALLDYIKNLVVACCGLNLTIASIGTPRLKFVNHVSSNVNAVHDPVAVIEDPAGASTTQFPVPPADLPLDPVVTNVPVPLATVTVPIGELKFVEAKPFEEIITAHSITVTSAPNIELIQ